MGDVMRLENKWLSESQKNATEFFSALEDSVEKNAKALEFLKEIISDNHDRVRIGYSNVIVMGELATYCLSTETLIATLTNPFSQRVRPGLPQTEVHPLDHWVLNERSACIQVDSSLDVPALDLLVAVILGLLNDKNMFVDPGHWILRVALIGTYGYCLSPITEVLSRYLREEYSSSLYLESFEIAVPGTHGFTWFLGYRDPQVHGFTISSSVRGAPRRIHSHDTSPHSQKWSNMDKMVGLLREAPKSLLDSSGDWNRFGDDFLEPIKQSVAEVWAPLRRQESEKEGSEDGDSSKEWGVC